MRPEILAPGGSPGAVYAAIRAGADAVYMGGRRFGARAFADNPDNTELLGIIDNVHLHGKKIYITVNTVLTEGEFSPLYSFIDEIYRQGVDAVIVQDFGVMKFIHEHFPDLHIHASTQMSIMGPSAANMLARYGVTRIVPARELSLDELRALRKGTALEIEVFVHGALCCSMSGQCLMSSMIGGRSGNRGACAQPCRKLYSYNGKDKSYYLSLKDLCTLPYLNELIACGMDSFKIEGRMKKPEYVALTTEMYRKYTDMYYELGDEGYASFIENSDEYKKDMQMLSDIYNRGGFTQGYLVADNTSKSMLSGKRPGHEGVIVGEVVLSTKDPAAQKPHRPDNMPSWNKKNDRHNRNNKKIENDEIKVKFSEEIFAGDVLEIRDENDEKIHEHTMKNPAASYDEILIKTGYNAPRIRKGFSVVRIRNNSLIDRLNVDYPPTMPKVSVSGKLTAGLGKELKLEATCIPDSSSNNSSSSGSGSGSSGSDLMEPEIIVPESKTGICTVTGNIVQPAQSHAATKDDIRKKIMVSGDSEFEWKKLDIEIDDNVFLPAGELKSLRRELFAGLKESICDEYRRTGDGRKPTTVEQNADLSTAEQNSEAISSTIQNSEALPPRLIADCRTLAQFNISNSSDIVSDIYLRVEDMDEEDVRKALESANKPVYVYLPRVARGIDSVSASDNIGINPDKRMETYFNLTEFDNAKGYIACNPEEIAYFNDTEIFNTHNEIQNNTQNNIRIPLRTADNLYVRNTFAYECYRELGAEHCSLSVEMSENEIRRFPRIDADILIYGRVSAMILLNHPGDDGKLEDDYGNIYNVIDHKKGGYTEILDKEPVDRIYELKDVSYDKRVLFTTETGDEVTKVLGRCAGR